MDSADIDREARGQLADAILAYLRGEIQSFAFEDRKWGDPPLIENKDQTVQMLCYDTWLIHDDEVEHPISVSPDTWQWLRRLVVLLRTDLRLTTERRRTWHRKQLVGLGGLALIGLGIWLSVVCSAWWPAAVAWAVAGMVALPYSEIRRREPDPELEQLGRWMPFRSEAQWHSYEHLLKPDEVPAYDPAIHNTPYRGEGEARRIRAAWLLLGPLYGTLWLPALLRRETAVLHLVESS